MPYIKLPGTKFQYLSRLNVDVSKHRTMMMVIVMIMMIMMMIAMFVMMIIMMMLLKASASSYGPDEPEGSWIAALTTRSCLIKSNK